MQVSEGSDTFEFRSPHGMKAAHSRLRTFAGIAVRHLQHFNHPGRAWHDLSGPQDTLTVVLAEIGGRCEARTNLHRPAALTQAFGAGGLTSESQLDSDQFGSGRYESAQKSRRQKLKPKPHSKRKPLVKANPPINKGRSNAAASQEVDYFAATVNGSQSKDHVLGLSEKFVPGPHPDAKICSPSCAQKDPDLIHQGELQDLQWVFVGQSYSVERRWTVDGQPAQVLDPKNSAFDFEILHSSTETNPPFQIEYQNDPNH